MKKFKKFTALLLCMALMIPFAALSAFAETTDEATGVTVAAPDTLSSAFADGDSLILFVTGIGQSNSYLFDESYLADGVFENGTLSDYENYSTLIAEGKYQAKWNLFNNFNDALGDSETIKTIISVACRLLLSMFIRRNLVKTEDLNTLVDSLFRYNIVDENGNLNQRVITPRYTCSVADYPTATDADGNVTCEAKGRFYGSIPCADIAREALGENYEQYLYCYNYSAFSYTSDNVDGLHDFITTVLETNTVGADNVVLVPMSMGASVVSTYLAKYPSQADNHVKRVVSIVGCWNGSDVVYDLLTKQYADNSADLFYNGIIAEMVGEPYGYLVNFALRLFSKASLRDFIDDALGVIADRLLLKTPSLMALVPSYDYAEISDRITSAAVKAETDANYQAQSTLDSRIEALEAQGITFSFVAGYGLAYGAQTADYKAFGFMKSAATTNSDEIINISSTVPGTSYVAPGKAFENTDGRVLSPDGSLDISTSLYSDRAWYFYGQKHELEYNNTAISLAINLALGQIKTVADCDSADDEYYYPQFNDSRNLKTLTRTYIPDMNSFLASNSLTLTGEQAAVYNKVLAMIASTVNNREADDALIEEFYNMLVDMGVYTLPAEDSTFSKIAASAFEKSNGIIYKLFGAKGFLDLPKC